MSFNIIMSEWTEFCKQFACDNGISYKEALSQAGPYYRKFKRGQGGAIDIAFPVPPNYAGAGRGRGKKI